MGRVGGCGGGRLVGRRRSIGEGGEMRSEGVVAAARVNNGLERNLGL